VLRLRWEDVNWGRHCFYVRSPKTERHKGKEGRWVPLFPELYLELRDLFEADSSEGKEFVINRYRSLKQNLRTTFDKIVKHAGLDVFPSPFRNLRMTRSNEVYRRWGAFKESQWIGHSGRVREDHYLSITDDDFEAASEWSVQPEVVENRPENGGKNHQGGNLPPFFPPARGGKSLQGVEVVHSRNQR
jgi:integrase